MNTRTKIALGVAVGLMLGGLIYTALRRDGDATSNASRPASSSSSGATEPATVASAASHAAAEDGADALAPLAPDASSAVLLSRRWGSGREELGRDRPAEGNPEGPMSFAPAGEGLLVLDQVNGRISRYDARGRLDRTSEVPTTTQDLAVARDGSVAALDRLGQKKITLLDPNGRKIGELPLDAAKIGEPGLTTGVFVDGKDVYVEKEHGALVHVGTISGEPADPGKELTGRPSRDGALLLTAGLSSPREGRAFLNGLDRKTGSLRFARAIQFARPARAIVLLDSDLAGAIYLGVAAGPAPEAAHVACLDPADGHVTGRVVLPLSDVPEESFRDFAVSDDGSIVFAVRSEQGVEYRSARCAPL